jgi:two-component sensor histidine kinase
MEAWSQALLTPETSHRLKNSLTSVVGLIRLKASVSSQIDQEASSTSQGVRRHASLASNGTSNWTATPFGVLEATAMRPLS